MDVISVMMACSRSCPLSFCNRFPDEFLASHLFDRWAVALPRTTSASTLTGPPLHRVCVITAGTRILASMTIGIKKNLKMLRKWRWCRFDLKIGNPVSFRDIWRQVITVGCLMCSLKEPLSKNEVILIFASDWEMNPSCPECVSHFLTAKRSTWNFAEL